MAHRACDSNDDDEYYGCEYQYDANDNYRAHTPKIEGFSSQNLMLPTERACSN